MSTGFSALSFRTPGVHGPDFTPENVIWWGTQQEFMMHVVPLSKILGTARDTGHYGGTQKQVTISNITAASPAVVTSNAHGLVNGDIIEIVNVRGDMGATVNNKIFKVASAAANTFALNTIADAAVSTVSKTYSGRGVVTKMEGASTILRPGLLMSFNTSLNGWQQYVPGGANGTGRCSGVLWRETNMTLEGQNTDRWAQRLVVSGKLKIGSLIYPGDTVPGGVPTAADVVALRARLSDLGFLMDDWYTHDIVHYVPPPP